MTAASKEVDLNKLIKALKRLGFNISLSVITPIILTELVIVLRAIITNPLILNSTASTRKQENLKRDASVVMTWVLDSAMHFQSEFVRRGHDQKWYQDFLKTLDCLSLGIPTSRAVSSMTADEVLEYINKRK